MSTQPEKIVSNYDSKSKKSKEVAQAQNLKTISGPDKKELVMDLIFSIIEEIDEGDTDTEFETLLKAMVPGMIDSFAVMLKTSAGCKKLFGCFK